MPVYIMPMQGLAGHASYKYKAVSKMTLKQYMMSMWICVAMAADVAAEQVIC